MIRSPSLADALVGQVERVLAKRDRWIGISAEHPEMASGMHIGIAMMQHHIMDAVKAAASGDATAMFSAHEALKAYSDED